MSPTLHTSTATQEESAASTPGAPRDLSEILNPLGLLQPRLARIESIAVRTIGAVVVIGGLGFLLISLVSTPA
ncbi:hypothetical protein [Leifsonia sp. Leaf264]|uniref:hypothetical protein n=1 Tax=Leifsonia sp. Leaf264 TaxID=1736314 RepID=UPI0006FEAE26|nr:hypothetical protein [Leifsonia sp. Leaf264]KQO97724.1 hypothetical protein ASF30_15110 [Leifsonia sp. Leaf264]